MKGFNQVPLAIIIVSGGVLIVAFYTGFSGLLEVNCSIRGCEVRLDNR